MGGWMLILSPMMMYDWWGTAFGRLGRSFIWIPKRITCFGHIRLGAEVLQSKTLQSFSLHSSTIHSSLLQSNKYEAAPNDHYMLE